MKKLIIAVFLSTSLVGCGMFDRNVAALTGNSISCIEGVKYIQFTSGASVLVDQNGKPKTC